MAKRRKKSREAESYRALAKWTTGIVLIAFGLIFALAAVGLAGLAGSAIFGFGFSVIGIAAFLLPVLLIGTGVSIMMERTFIAPLTATGVVLIIIATLTFLGIVTDAGGGAAGAALGGAAAELFGIAGAIILLLAVVAIGLIIATDIVAILKLLKSAADDMSGRISQVKVSLPEKKSKRDEEEEDEPEAEEEAEEEVEEAAPEREPVVTMFNRNDDRAAEVSIPNFDAEYEAPPLSLLGEDKGKPGVGDIKANANIIKRTFQNFGISVEMDEVSVGPTVTRYAIKPAEGVRLQKIVGLQTNLELALAAHPVRIEAPIPGKSLVGIEVPNAAKAMVGLGGVIGAPEWSASKKPLLAAVGRDIAGVPHYVNVAKMPHGLIAGATGSGKSVAIHAVITSLLYRNGPNQLRFIMIDPKRVELTLYNGIPHLLTPVITDPKKAIFALKWAAKEMDRRYSILEERQVRDIESYHATVVEPAKKRKSAEIPEAMPYIAIVVDELADIMQTYPRELEAAIVRLAQMSRAVGIHLILSTQRPSVNVITGLIKANVPTRLALQVASQIDSRTILDASGAELLLGAGDMLYQSADMQKPVRLQTAYISEQEVKKVVSHIKQHNAGSLSSLDLGANTNNTGVHEANDAIMMAAEDDDVDDDLFGAAREAVEEAGRASTSYLQRKLRIGYSRAARLMDLLEDKGVIGPADGARPREVLSRSGGGSGSDEDEDI
ncbi:MAG TPA: DNA translocase FtsK 4TM domain-containing protein [Candidatus Paceibacterota bacterium]